MKTAKLSQGDLSTIRSTLGRSTEATTRSNRAEVESRTSAQLKAEKENREKRTKAGDDPDRTNEEIIKALNIRQITVQSELGGPNVEKIFKAVWNNGTDPLEVHILDAKSERDALLEAEGIVIVADAQGEPPQSERSFQGFRNTAANKLPETLPEKESATRGGSTLSNEDQIANARVAAGQTPAGIPAGLRGGEAHPGRLDPGQLPGVQGAHGVPDRAAHPVVVKEGTLAGHATAHPAKDAPGANNPSR